MKEEYKDWVIYIIGLLSLVTFLQTCGIKSNVRDVEYHMVKQLDSLSSIYIDNSIQIEDKVISETEMIKLIKTTPAWKTLRIEEISDKEKISINALEEKQ